jgi:hypothetical protein
MQHDDESEHVPDPRMEPLPSLADLRGAERDLQVLVGDAEALAAEAAAAATAADRRRVQSFVAAQRPRGRRGAGWWIAAAALLVGALLWRPSGPAAADGQHGGSAPVVVERAAGSVRVRMRDQLPPGESYHLRLECDGAAPLSAASDAPDWTFPPAWTEALATAKSAQLIVQVGDRSGLAIVHRVRLQ